MISINGRQARASRTSVSIPRRNQTRSMLVSQNDRAFGRSCWPSSSSTSKRPRDPCGFRGTSGCRYRRACRRPEERRRVNRPSTYPIRQRVRMGVAITIFILASVIVAMSSQYDNEIQTQTDYSHLILPIKRLVREAFEV